MSNMRAHRRRAQRRQDRDAYSPIDGIVMMSKMMYPEPWCHAFHEKYDTDSICAMLSTTAIFRATVGLIESIVACPEHGYSDPTGDFLKAVDLFEETDPDEPELGVYEIGWKVHLNLACGCPKVVEMSGSPGSFDGIMLEAWTEAKEWKAASGF